MEAYRALVAMNETGDETTETTQLVTRSINGCQFTLIPGRSYQAWAQGWRVYVADVTHDCIGPIAERLDYLPSQEAADATVAQFNDGSSQWAARIDQGEISHEGEKLLANARRW